MQAPLDARTATVSSAAGPRGSQEARMHGYPWEGYPSSLSASTVHTRQNVVYIELLTHFVDPSNFDSGP
eukprot:8750334-Pyramimonas_sp.AAC.1